MMFNPAKSSQNIKNEFVDYIATTYAFSDKSLQNQLVDELNKNISRGPLLEINDIFKSGCTINELIDRGVLSPLFRELESQKPDKAPYKRSIPLDRPLYLHQEKAIRNIVEGKNAVISTGTGSGKTNCFLIPVINALLREKENGTLNDGIRALFIYPMNALANDQMKNIRNMLMFYPDITFGVYNGGTENHEDEAISVYESMFANEKIEKLRHKLPNEMLSRDEMKESPPNILFTNYAMLEHLLFRPNDDILFTNADFKFVVLDEAHIYTGATGIETSLLLRRLRARITAKGRTQFILTSATLGSDESSNVDIIKFAKNLCGVDFQNEDIIRSSRENYLTHNGLISYKKEVYKDLADDKKSVYDVLKQYDVDVLNNIPENELLYNFLVQSDLYDKMRRNVSGICELSQLADILNVDIDTATSFISICTRAQKNGKALLDAKYHFFIRSLEGCYIALSSTPKLFLNRRRIYKENNVDYAVFEVAVCSDCGRIALVGSIVGDKLIQPNKLEEKIKYFYLFNDHNTEIEDEDESETINKIYYLCPKCGTIIPENRLKYAKCDCDLTNYIKVVEAKELVAGARCGNCHTGKYRRFYLGNDAATSVLATSLYEELPEIEYVEEDTSKLSNNIFANLIKANKKVEKKMGRQFLAFSDSRQEAARFACYLSKSYNEFLRRRGICHIIHEKKEDIINQKYNISDFVTKLTSYFSTNHTFAKSNNDNTNQNVTSNKNAWVAMLNELSRFNSPTSLISLGQIQFEYLGNTPEMIALLSDSYNVSKQTIRSLLNILIFEIVKAGAICTDTESDIDDDDREYIFYSSNQRFMVHSQTSENKKPNVTSWDPKSKIGGGFFKTSKMYYVIKALNISPEEAFEFLRQYFDYLTKPEYGNNYLMTDPNKDGMYVLPAKYFRVLINGDSDAHWYKCKKCGKITPFNIENICPSIRCGGCLEEVDTNTVIENNHFAKLYLSDRMSPLFIKEHTAQLSKKESAEYQEQFIKKEINALSCSTTFEMGVDVGDLETVFLRDVPPLPSNYSQRAGRAGRSINSDAFVLTFAKLSSHDLSFFKDPKRMINGTIMPPLFKVDNEKIVRRHIYAVALSMFFSDNREMYDNNNASKFINEKGYLKFIEWIESHPERLKAMLKSSIPDINNLHERIGIDDFSWIESFSGTEGAFTQLISEFESNVENFEKEIKRLKKDNISEAANCERKLNIYKSNKLIDFLARGNILPRYGFPVDTVELYQNSTSSNISKLRLSRDLQIAIAEYAPSSEVIANGRLYTSRYIKKSAIGNNKQDWHTAYIGVCKNKKCDGEVCGAVNYSLTPIPSEGIPCSVCGNKLKRIDFYESIEPRSGFVAERRDKDVPMKRQEKNYKSEDCYIGNKSKKIIDTKNFCFNGIKVSVESTSNDSLLVKSYNNFYVCPVCGYSIAEDESIGDKKAEKDMRAHAIKIETAHYHESLFGTYNCKSKELYRRSLHHIFNTDVAKISFDCDTSDYNTMISVMYALLNAISHDLNIERRDIKACLSKKMQNGFISHSIIIYDSVPGGAGHSRRLVTSDGKMLYKVFKSALSNMVGCNCDPSCYNCLRSYENQKIHDHLDRHFVIDFLSKFMGEIEVLEN